jgi:hypothetical protein
MKNVIITPLYREILFPSLLTNFISSIVDNSRSISTSIQEED